MPEAFNEQLAEQIDHYIERLFVPPDESLAQNLRDAAAAGAPHPAARRSIGCPQLGHAGFQPGPRSGNWSPCFSISWRKLTSGVPSGCTFGRRQIV